MARVRVGTSGWGYDDWRGVFYPTGAPAGEYLRRYARVFDLVEVDSSYYRAPSADLTRRWAAETPAGFTFAPKVPGDVTHKAALRDVDEAVTAFVEALAPLERAGKLGPVLLQMGPGFTRDRDAEAIRRFLAGWPRRLPLAVELRHASWWVPETWALLEEHRAALVWSVNDASIPPPVVTGDFLYVRFIGDRALTRFDSIQRDHSDVIRWWAERVGAATTPTRDAFVLVNNHFMGFAPATAVSVAQSLGLPPPDLAAAARAEGQRALF